MNPKKNLGVNIKSFDEITSHIQEWLVDRYNLKVDINERYMDSSLIDSFDVIKLIDFIESSYTIKFSSDDLHDQRFHTINGLCELIMVKISDV